MTIAESMFRPWESRINSWPDFQVAANTLGDSYPSRQLVWRGQRRAEWGVESSLYRVLRARFKRPPTENEMVTAEMRILELARRDWRFDQIGALETLAHLQHFGAPTRLLDVTANPLVALWFAVEESPDDENADARLFGFIVHPKEIELNGNWGGRRPHWADLRTDADRVAKKWGTGTQRRMWRPPAYTERISSQNGAFLVDGVPVSSDDSSVCLTGPDSREKWSLADIRESGSLNLRLAQIREGRLPEEAAPVFTYRIAASAKGEIRRQIEQRYGYRASSIYSDMSGLAQYIAAHPEKLT
jgi:hypothetical protein